VVVIRAGCPPCVINQTEEVNPRKVQRPTADPLGFATVGHTQKFGLTFALSDLMRFFETVYSTVRELPIKAGNDNFPSDSVSLEFGRYAAGYFCALKLVPKDGAADLLERAMPKHGSERVYLALRKIYEHAQDRGAVAIGGSSAAASQPLQVDELVDPDVFKGWSTSDVRDFVTIQVFSGTQSTVDRRRAGVW
jgi:hypothetical protein